MKKSIIFVSVVFLVVVHSTVAISDEMPPAPPSLYDDGPSSPVLNSTDITNAERAAFGLLEAIMQVTEAKIHTTGCTSTVGTYPVELFTNGRFRDDPTEDNSVTVLSFGGSYTLKAILRESVAFRGQKINIKQIAPKPGFFDGSEVKRFKGVAVYNEVNNMLFQWGRVKVSGSTGRFNTYQSKVIKDFYQNTMGGNNFNILDWGLQSLYKFGFPVEKYWQRSKVSRSDGQEGVTLFVKDRLVGSSSCRITVYLSGFNEQDFILQDGFLEVSLDKPSDPLGVES